MSNESKTPYRIPSLKVILNGTPESHRKRVNFYALAAILSTSLPFIFGTGSLIIPALLILETYRQVKLADKK